MFDHNDDATSVGWAWEIFDNFQDHHKHTVRLALRILENSGTDTSTANAQWRWALGIDE